MAAPAIDVAGLGKYYRLGGSRSSQSLRDTVGEWSSRTWNRLRGGDAIGTSERDFWALSDVSFQVAEGEAVGIIGHNGAGKSTLLKILSRITEPTRGRIAYYGRIGSLLEVGTGFHPQLTGRDNIYLSGAVLGMRRREIAARFDEIVDFSGVEAFLDTPVRHYSSGMFLRLGFAVAACLDTEILLVDEVLAVGDAAFQKKCLARMDDVCREGRTIVFVSHNLTAVRSLCRRAILLEHGRLKADGPAKDVLSEYLREGDESSDGRARSWDEDCSDGQIQMIAARLLSAKDNPADPIDTSDAFIVEWDYANRKDGAVLVAAMTMHNEQGMLVFDQGSWDPPAPVAAGRYRTRCTIPGDLLNDGTYFVSLQFHSDGQLVRELPNVLCVAVLDGEAGRHNWFGKWEGVIRPRLDWKTVPLDATKTSGKKMAK